MKSLQQSKRRWIGGTVVVLAVATVVLLSLTGTKPVDRDSDRPEVLRVAEAQGAAKAEEPIDFNRDIRPILSDKCFSCHGPDNQHRAAELRLDVTEDGDNYAGAYFAIEPGDPAASELIRRIHHSKSKFVMPPPDTGLKLSDEEKALLRRWIEQGAAYQNHWAFIAPKASPLPQVADQAWPRQPIDYFVLAELERRGLKPSAEAPRPTLLRRLTLDLTGLPPTPEEIDAFLADKSDDAYEKAVDRLLASPRFGERMAVPWLDAARYADTNGFSIDDHRDMWLWREWVIDAYNRNMPYDRFIIEQVAGDLLPDATDRQKLATGFLRNSMNTHEGGTIAEEYRVIYIADKIDTVSTVFMGLTMRCAQCHDHKYDPLSQREFYRMFAFFDTAHEPGKGATNANTPPILRMDGPITDNAAWRQDVERRIATLKRYTVHPPELIKPRAEWEQKAAESAQGELAAALNTPSQDRSDAHWDTINKSFAKTTELFDRHTSTIKREIAVLEKELEAGQSSVMVMQEKGPKPTYLLTRGAYDQPDKSEVLTPGVPAVLPLIDHDVSGADPTRLDLAKWLVRDDHPLTARVAVNRTWQMLFGNGLVTTPADFGSQGAYPTHPELLDWLATDFVDSGWDVKRLVKQIVMSATYRQTSRAPREAIEADPANALLARASRFRLPAEFIRDGALAISGQLDPRIGGPSVYPAQPHGLWREVSHFGYPRAFTAQAFYPSDDAGLTRRTMYTFWKRTSPPPSLTAFDAPTREVCTVQRANTNTPLQALVLLNDPEYVNAARELARLTIDKVKAKSNARIAYMFLLATGRVPDDQELAVFEKHLDDATTRFKQDPDAAERLVGERDITLAGWTSVASVILNLDETITRE